MSRIIFSYLYSVELNFMERSSVKVIEEDGKYLVECDRLREKPSLEQYKENITNDVVEQIKQVYKRNKEIFEIKRVEFPPVLDGCSNSFVFSDGESTNEIIASNIWYYIEYPSEGENARLILKAFGEIKDILVAAGVDEKYFVLDCE